ncbi:NAD(P)H-dependent oxidoreductase [Campylobacter sp. US33a]|uniref:NAD(P)H-dependent oxidoreductase n=1 Tax=Campylobacter sp. US33a TaxID=2498120 RepID=UPI001068B3A9|nr:NAD(P)H-dependent oxidoreductase [Campylobacter sp. US33a]TEY01611.1 NAD(P)H-dependent oxidoreductase [Campylobacter sp. US33a]
MKNLELFEKRFSCRNFKNEKIKNEDLNFILKAGVMSPSSLGLEPWRFLVVQDEKSKEEIAKIANNQNHVKEASAIIAIVSRLDFTEYFEDKLKARNLSKEELEKRLKTYSPFLQNMNENQKLAYAREQAFIALGSMLYAATLLDIGTCTIGGFDKNALDTYFKLDIKKEQSTVLIALGYKKDSQIPKKARFSFDEVVKFL